MNPGKMKFGETRDYVPKSNAHLLDEFQKSVIWHDFRCELDVWLTEIRDMLEDQDGQLSDKQSSNLRGSAMAVRYVLNLPEILSDNFKTDQKQAEKEKTDGGNQRD